MYLPKSVHIVVNGARAYYQNKGCLYLELVTKQDAQASDVHSKRTVIEFSCGRVFAHVEGPP